MSIIYIYIHCTYIVLRYHIYIVSGLETSKNLKLSNVTMKQKHMPFIQSIAV